MGIAPVLVVLGVLAAVKGIVARLVQLVAPQPVQRQIPA